MSSLSLELKHILQSHFEQKNINKDLVPGIDYLPCTAKFLDIEDLYNMVESCMELTLTHSHFTTSFEKELSRRVGLPHALFVNSGSSANLLAISTLTSPRLKERRLKEGDEVITVAASFPTTVNPIIQNRAIPVFIDIELPYYQVNISYLEQALSPKTKAVILAHTLGNPFNISEVVNFCSKNKLWLIEDCCDALGSTWSDNHSHDHSSTRPCGSFGDISTLSFYPAHHITTGEGGAILLKDNELKKIAQSFRDWGRDCWCPPGKDDSCGKRFKQNFSSLNALNALEGDNNHQLPIGYDHKYTYSHIGYNLKGVDMQAALGITQLNKLDQFITSRRNNFSYISQKLKANKLDNYFILPGCYSNANPSWFGFPLTLKEEYSQHKNNLIKFLEEKKKIGTRPLFAGNLTRQPLYSHNKNIYRIASPLTITDIIMNATFWIGIHPHFNENHLNYMVDSLSFFVSTIKYTKRT